ncbi:(R)-mandelonitrile lyase-like [Cryptomeria japonica]|uniref:(R)-mandelonitrile lyase-like n=1 Tax=Cryptomeria japonica TaxID=3369 RepID=UPI0027DA828B|nr:(R)-mandelonitrile lyase-like [Cryptomeria japonica]
MEECFVRAYFVTRPMLAVNFIYFHVEFLFLMVAKGLKCETGTLSIINGLNGQANFKKAKELVLYFGSEQSTQEREETLRVRMELLHVIPWLLFLTSSHLLSTMEAAKPTSGAPSFPYPFITLDLEKAAARKYDYIIVGGGTSACPLAATLSQNYTVLVLERGGSPYGNPEIESGEYFGKPLMETDKFTSIAQGFMTEDGVQVDRARVLGGGTALNAGFYSRASRTYIQRMGWDEKLVNESFLWVEKMNAFEPDHLSRFSSALKDALLEVGIRPDNGYTVDHVEGTKISASTFDNNGKRHTAADLLKNANPNNIVVLLNATASRILFNSSSGKLKAQGVEFMNSVSGGSYQALIDESSCCSEVILSAGSIGSPQLLLLSGIGPSRDLRKINIPVLKHVPSVGQGIQDNPRATIILQSPIPLNTSSIQVVGIMNSSANYIFSSSFVQQTPSNGSGVINSYGGVIFEKLAYPLSRGSLSLISKDPRENPSVRYNYYSNPQDLQKCVQGVKVIAGICETNSMKNFAYNDKSSGTSGLRFTGPSLPKNKSDEVALGKFCMENINTMWHFHGGCDIGSVIDKRYRLKGVDALRVVDGSTFRDGPGTNPQATTMMLGRYVGVKILRERGAST